MSIYLSISLSIYLYIYLDARLTRTSSDDREESSETSEIDSGIREEEEGDSAGENNESTTVDIRSSPDTIVKNLQDSRKQVVFV